MQTLERISEYKDKIIEIISEKQKEKKKRNEQNVSNPSTPSSGPTSVLWKPQGKGEERKEKGARSLFEEIMVKTSQIG